MEPPYIRDAANSPATVRAKPTSTLRSAFIKALSIVPPRIIRIDSKEKEEKVVNPPRNPVTRNIRRERDTMDLSASPATKPIKRQPNRFTAKVPQGKESPKRRPATRETK
jgi:hypothetical protein